MLSSNGRGNFIVAFFFFIFTLSSSAQQIPPSFEKTVDSLVKTRPETYFGIDGAIGNNRQDTILMRYFANVAAKRQYLDGQSFALNQLGRGYRLISQFDKSLALHQKALEISRKTRNIEFEVFSLNMIGVVYRKIDAIQAALERTQEALELAQSVENPSKGIKRSINVSLNNIGNIYRILEQYDLAIDQFKESLVLEEELGNKLGIAINLQNLGECLEAQGKLEEALTNYRSSLAYNREINSDIGQVICQYSIAHVYVHQGKTNEAVDMLRPALAVAEKLGEQDIITSVLINLGWALIHLEEYTEAETHLMQGLEIAQKHNLPSAISEANTFLSDLWKARGDYEKALEYYKSAQHFDSEISNDRNMRYVYDVLLRYDSEKQRKSYESELRKNNTILLISGIALALLAGIFYILYRQYQLKNEKKLLTLEQSMLRSQMNPHFLFNSLNSIKLYIINNEQKNAVHYLNKFSKLVRKILEASSLREIPLAEELETVELYMNIENIRFSNEINFNITIADDIDVHQVKIPSLILQPFLENALWHGLSSKEDEKKINLNISKDAKGFMNISITDNGVGRRASEKIKQSKVLKRKSVGIDITKERLANFSKDYENSFDIEIIDLYNDDSSAAGTQVVLHIPMV